MSISRSSPYASALSPEFAISGFLAQRPAHGYDLYQRLTAELGQVWHISLSQVYNILKRLEDQGAILGETETQDKLPARRLFHLTEAGQQRFETWLRTPKGCSVRAIRVEFTTRLYFALAREHSLARSLIDAQAAAIRSGLARLETSLDELPAGQRFNRLGLALRIGQLTSILDWLDACRGELGLSE